MRRRKQLEIDIVLKALENKNDNKSTIIRDVLSNKLTEQQVFIKFVKNKNDEERDMDDYYVARDAAKYISCLMSAEELGVDITNVKIPNDDYIRIKRSEYTSILERLDRLESLNNITVKEHKTLYDAPNDLICQADACKLVGCSKGAIKRWVEKGIIKSYKNGHSIYYSKRQLVQNPHILKYKQTWMKQ